MSSSDLELQKMVKSFRVSDLQSLLVYAGRNKGGKKSELQNRALDLIKIHSDSINMKIRELHMNRYQQTRGHTESSEMFPLAAINDPIGSNYSGTPHHKSLMDPAVRISGYVPPVNHQMLRGMPGINVMQQYPINPDVNFKDLPFYDVLREILKPTSLAPLRVDGLVQEKELIFYLGPQDLRELDSCTDVQVQLRMGAVENSQEVEDELPTSMCLKVNHKVANLPNPIPTNKPGQDPKRPRRPVDISCIVKRSITEPQIVCLSWASAATKVYVAGVFLVRKQTSSILIKRLKEIGVRNPDHTTAMIKEKLCHDRDSEIATMSLRGSLMCPLGKIKMTLPCRALTCSHLQCFDAALYVQMNEKKPKWICPVCDKPAVFKSLAIDGLFLDITRKVPTECTEVQFHENGSWTPVIPLKKAPEIHEPVVQPEVPKIEPPKKDKNVELISIDSGSDTEDSWATQPPKKKPYKPVGIITPVLMDTNENATPVMKSYDMPQPSTSKSVPSTSKTNTLSLEKTMTQSNIYANYVPVSPSPPYSPITPGSPIEPYEPEYEPESPFSPQSLSPYSSTSSKAPTNAFQEPVDILNNSSSSTAGQCSYDLDLYSIINPSEPFPYQENVNNALAPSNEDTPPVIDLD